MSFWEIIGIIAAAIVTYYVAQLILVGIVVAVISCLPRKKGTKDGPDQTNRP